MNRPLQACAIALCMTVAPSLHAATFTAYAEDHLDLAPPTPSNLIPTFTATAVNWNWSRNFINAINTLGITASDDLAHPVSSANPLARFSLVSMDVDGPGLLGMLDPFGQFSVLSEQLSGSIRFTSRAGVLTARSTTLTLSDLHIDHQSNQVLARIQNASGATLASDLAVFQFDDTAYVLPQGSYIPVLTCLPTNPQCIARVDGAESHPTLGNLRFTSEGLAMWNETFQLQPIGVNAMKSLGSLGSLSAAPVPEPSTWAMVGIGLAGIGLARRRQAS